MNKSTVFTRSSSNYRRDLVWYIFGHDNVTSLRHFLQAKSESKVKVKLCLCVTKHDTIKA